MLVGWLSDSFQPNALTLTLGPQRPHLHACLRLQQHLNAANRDADGDRSFTLSLSVTAALSVIERKR